MKAKRPGGANARRTGVGPAPPLSSSTKLQSRLAARLRAAHFRYLNERLYTTDSIESFRFFQANPEHFALYHEGYREQETKWPVKPTQLCIELLQQRICQCGETSAPIRSSPNCKATTDPYRIVDMGCGQATIASMLDSSISTSWSARRGFPVRVHSFDLVAENELVTARDVAQGTGLSEAYADAVVFCLSLMGPNYGAMVDEGIRLLRRDPSRPGLLLIVEIASRFQEAGKKGSPHRSNTPVTNKGTPASLSLEQRFLLAIQSRGLRLQRRSLLNNYFVLFALEASVTDKTTRQTFLPMPALKPCLYKKR
ncbi:hypothetical protein CCYA_CCYA01G0055 [Cyanidiococcus yangmingshanensis]|nr:hypothetical protein CCYA_CCYA01G0055 [Cyanidiococcus yangmingshanensis]